MNRLKLTLEQLLDLLADQNPLVKGDRSVKLDKFDSVLNASEKSVSFIGQERKDKFDLVKNSKAGCLILDKPFLEQLDNLNKGTLYIGVESPRECFALIISDILPSASSLIHPTASVHVKAKIGKNVSIGANCVIGECVISENTIIHPNVTIMDNVFVGSKVIIWPGAVIGADGFGYLKTQRGVINFPHIGGVIIEDEVHVGANACIDRGALNNTIIKKGAKIDNLVHIAHNVTVGQESYIIANAMIGGSTRIGNRTWIAPNASVRDGLEIGNDVVVGMGAVVVKNISENTTVLGNPARKLIK